MPELDISSATLALLERIARAIRRELGEVIDAYPGGRSPEQADPLNRSFRAIVRSLLESDLPSTADLNSLAFFTLRRISFGLVRRKARILPIKPHDPWRTTHSKHDTQTSLAEFKNASVCRTEASGRHGCHQAKWSRSFYCRQENEESLTVLITQKPPSKGGAVCSPVAAWERESTSSSST
jgi:hypothetical protein